MSKPSGNTLGYQSSLKSVGQLDFDGIVQAARDAHQAGLPHLEALLADLGPTDHRRARRTALNRIRHCYDAYGQKALLVLRDVKIRSRGKKWPGRYFVAAALAEFKRRGWIQD